jgi:hypothetical protein
MLALVRRIRLVHHILGHSEAPDLWMALKFTWGTHKTQLLMTLSVALSLNWLVNNMLNAPIIAEANRSRDVPCMPFQITYTRFK